MAKTKTAAAAPTNTIPFADIEAALGTASARFQEGTAHARESAKVAAGNVKHAVNTGVFNAAFGFSYGVVFSAVFLTELLPEDSTLRRGLEEGADSALEAHAKRRGIDANGDETDDEVEAFEEAEPASEKPKARKPKKPATRAKRPAAAAKTE